MVNGIKRYIQCVELYFQRQSQRVLEIHVFQEEVGLSNDVNPTAKPDI